MELIDGTLKTYKYPITGLKGFYGGIGLGTRPGWGDKKRDSLKESLYGYLHSQEDPHPTKSVRAFN